MLEIVFVGIGRDSVEWCWVRWFLSSDDLVMLERESEDRGMLFLMKGQT